MKRRTIWMLVALWVSLHLLLAAGFMLTIVDPFELIDQMTMPEICEHMIKTGEGSFWTWVTRCWDPSNVRDFFAEGLIGAFLLLSPFTLAFGYWLFRRGRRAVSAPEPGVN